MLSTALHHPELWLELLARKAGLLSPADDATIRISIELALNSLGITSDARSPPNPRHTRRSHTRHPHAHQPGTSPTLTSKYRAFLDRFEPGSPSSPGEALAQLSHPFYQ